MLNYKIYGDLSEATAPIIMLHGLLGSLDNWNGQAKKLSKTEVVIAVDLRNHGGSAHVKGMSYHEMADDLIELLDALNIGSCRLMGHSMGGKVAMTLALNSPSRVDRLCIVDIAPKAYKLRHQKILHGMMSLPLTEMQTRKDADAWLADWISTPAERGFLLKNLKRNESGFYWQCNLAEIVTNYLKISGFSNSNNRQFKKPTLFIRGGLSDYIQPEDIERIQDTFPEASVETLDDCGHLPHVENVNGFYQLLRDFM